MLTKRGRVRALSELRHDATCRDLRMRRDLVEVENGLEGLFSSVLLVYAPEDTQLERLVQGRGVPPDRARAMIAAQMPIEEKRRRAHHVVDNSGTVEETRRQVEEIWAQMTGR